MTRSNPAKVLDKIHSYQSKVKRITSDGSEFKSLHKEMIAFFKALNISKRDYNDLMQYPQATRLWFETNDNESKIARVDFLNRISTLLGDLEREYKIKVNLQ